MDNANTPGGMPINSGTSFQALITTLSNNQLQFTALMQMLTTAIENIGLISPKYATGAWTPTDNSGAGLVFTGVSAEYTQIGRLIFASATLTYPATASAASASIGGLPVASANAGYARGPAKVFSSAAQDVILRPDAAAATAAFVSGTGGGAALTNANLSGGTVSFILVYPVS